MTGFFNTKGTLTVSIGEGYLSSFEASTLKKGDVVRTARDAGYPSALLFNGTPFCECEVVILGSLFGARVVSTVAPRQYVPEPGSADDLVELLPTTVSLGSIQISLAELKGVGPNSLLSLGKPFSTEEDAELLVAGIPLARGKVVVIEEEMGIRITEVFGNTFEETNIRASGFLLDPNNRIRRVKDYDFRRPDKFSKNAILKIHDIHALFLRNLKVRLPEAASLLADKPYPALVDQCTYDEALKGLKEAGAFGCMAAENLPWRRPAEPLSAVRGRTPAKLLVEEENARHPVAPSDREYAEKLLSEMGMINRNPVLIYYREAAPLRDVFSRSADGEAVLSCLRGGWKSLVDLNLRPIPKDDPMAKPPFMHGNEMIVMVAFEERKSGTPALYIMYPYFTLEPFLRILG